jgi:hypothetical protein
MRLLLRSILPGALLLAPAASTLAGQAPAGAPAGAPAAARVTVGPNGIAETELAVRP